MQEIVVQSTKYPEIVVQGQMTRPGLIEGAGIVAQSKKPKAEP